MRSLILVSCAGMACSLSLAQLSFVDATAASGLGVAVHDTTTLFNQVGTQFYSMTGGCCVADFNQDGWQDIFLLGGGNGPDHLMINNGDGTFTDQAAAWGIGGAFGTHMGIGCSVGDYDGDGLMDIYITSAGPSALPTNTPGPGNHRLYRNTGTGFVDVAAAARVQFTSPNMPDGFGSTWGDYDRDGDLDLYIGGWMKASDSDRLYRNDGNGQFTDVTLAAGLTTNISRGFSPRFADMDGDLWPELLIASDFTTSKYLANNGDGTFTNITAAAGCGLDGNGMGNTIGDFDNNGRPDWYVSSIYSLMPNMNDVPGTGNMLYMCIGPHAFAESSVAMGVNDGGWGWGTVSGDFDLDGDEDIFETNGWTFPDLLGGFQWLTDPCYLYENQSGASFVEVGAAAGVGGPDQGRGMVRLDADNDGDLDVLVFALNGPPVYYQNQASGTWLRVFLDATGEPTIPTAGIGSVVEVWSGGVRQRRIIDAGSSFLSTSELSASFGLAGATNADVVRVRWSDGRTTTLRNIAASQTITLTPDSGPACPADLTTTGSTNGIPDGVINGSDFTYFLSLFASAHPASDLTTTGSTNGTPDGITNGSDFTYYLGLFAAGCP